MIFNPKVYDDQVPLPPTDKWKQGRGDIEAFTHGSMSLNYFSPEGIDYQTPHDQDELYFIIEGSGEIGIDSNTHSFSAGDTIFVKAGQEHRFIGNLDGIKVWAVLYGPIGGEKDQ